MIYFAVLVAALATADSRVNLRAAFQNGAAVGEGESVQVAIFSFNHGQSEKPPEDVKDGQNSPVWLAGMKKQLESKMKTLLAANPDVKFFCFADQEARGIARENEKGNMITAEWFCDENKDWEYIYDKKIGGTTKKMWVYTSAGCCRRSKNTDEIPSTKLTKNSLHYAWTSAVGLFRTKGFVWVKFPLPNGKWLQFIGTHSDTSSPMAAFGYMKSKITLDKDTVQIITGDMNIRIRDPDDPKKKWKCAGKECTDSEVLDKWKELTKNDDDKRHKAIGFRAVELVMTGSTLVFSKVPEENGHVLATYKYKVDDEKSYSQQPATKTLDHPLYKENKPQLGLLDFSLARHEPTTDTAVTTLAGSYHYLKGTDHLLHFQVFKITNKLKEQEQAQGEESEEIVPQGQESVEVAK